MGEVILTLCMLEKFWLDGKHCEVYLVECFMFSDLCKYPMFCPSVRLGTWEQFDPLGIVIFIDVDLGQCSV